VAATAIVVPVPEVEPVVERWRRLYTQDGAEGMPPHVTLLFPFVEDDVLVAGQMRELRAILAAFRPFDFSLSSAAEFPASRGGAPVLYLAPKPEGPFRKLTLALVDAFPQHQPYGGQFTDVIPHLTVAATQGAPFDEILRAVAPALPVEVTAREVHLMRYGDDGWRMKSRLHLGRIATPPLS
jgi:2'-5' RNA ligase